MKDFIYSFGSGIIIGFFANIFYDYIKSKFKNKKAYINYNSTVEFIDVNARIPNTSAGGKVIMSLVKQLNSQENTTFTQ